MRTSKTVAALTTVSLLALASTGARATIIWQGTGATNINHLNDGGPGNIITDGTFSPRLQRGQYRECHRQWGNVCAYVSIDAAHAAASAGFTSSGGDSSWGLTRWHRRFPIYQPAFSGLDTDYQNLLGNGIWASGSYTVTLQLTGLTTGDRYLFEWWVNDSRGSTRLTTASDGAAVTLNFNTSGNTSGGEGQYAIGIFTATTDTETIAFSSSTFDQINAYQLRDLGIPEPSTIMLLGLGSLLLWRFRKMA